MQHNGDELGRLVWDQRTCLTVGAIPAGSTQAGTSTGVLSTDRLPLTLTLRLTAAAKVAVITLCIATDHIPSLSKCW